MKKLPVDKELKDVCIKYGISRQLEGNAMLQERLLRYLESRRNARMWIIALISAIASIISALAAWYAVTKSVLLQ